MNSFRYLFFLFLGLLFGIKKKEGKRKNGNFLNVRLYLFEVGLFFRWVRFPGEFLGPFGSQNKVFEFLHSLPIHGLFKDSSIHYKWEQKLIFFKFLSSIAFQSFCKEFLFLGVYPLVPEKKLAFAFFLLHFFFPTILLQTLMWKSFTWFILNPCLRGW